MILDKVTEYYNDINSFYIYLYNAFPIKILVEFFKELKKQLKLYLEE